MANLPKQHRSVYEKSFNLKHVLKNLQGYKLASGGVHPAQLRQAREIYGDDEGKVYGALVSQEAGNSPEGGRALQGQRSKRRRRSRGNIDASRKVPKADRVPSSTSSSSIQPSTDSHDNISPSSREIPSPLAVGGASSETRNVPSNMVTSLNLLSAAYSDSSSGSSEEDSNKTASEPKLHIPDSIQQMIAESSSSVYLSGANAQCYQLMEQLEKENAQLKSLVHKHGIPAPFTTESEHNTKREEEISPHYRSHDNDSDPGDLGYFESVDTDDSDGSDLSATDTEAKGKRSTEMAVQAKPSSEFIAPSLKEWDSEKGKFVFSPSPLSSYVCWKCSKVGHLPSDCTVTVKDGGRRRGGQGLNIPHELKSLYSRCRELQKRKRDHCAECGVHSNLACCLDCGVIFCDGRGHLSSHLLSHTSHNQLYSYKLARMLKCCKASCPVVSVYDLLVCSHCLSKSFSQHYSMINATWSQSGLRAIPNALCCEDHFDCTGTEQTVQVLEKSTY